MSRTRYRYRELRSRPWPTVVRLDGVPIRENVTTRGEKLERFDDATGSRTTWNSCSHLVSVSSEGTLPMFVDDTHVYDYGGNWIAGVSDGPIGEFFSTLCDPVPPPEVAGPISRKALNNVLIQVPMTVSVPNMLWELKDGPAALLPRVTKWASGQTPADLLLWWKFGVEPTISDIKNCLKLWSTAMRRLAYLKKINRRLITVRYHDGRAWTPEGEGPPDDPEAARLWNPVEPALVSRRFLHEVDVDVTMTVYYDLQGLDEPLAFWNTLLASAGFANPAAVIWEGVPFSFVVDWFVRVGDWIETNLQVPIFNGDIRILNCHTTYRSRTIIDWYAATSYLGDWSLVGSTKVTGYFRRSGLPAGVLQTEGLTPMQQLLGAALLTSQGGTLWQRLWRQGRRKRRS